MSNEKIINAWRDEYAALGKELQDAEKVRDLSKCAKLRNRRKKLRESIALITEDKISRRTT